MAARTKALKSRIVVVAIAAAGCFGIYRFAEVSRASAEYEVTLAKARAHGLALTTDQYLDMLPRVSEADNAATVYAQREIWDGLKSAAALVLLNPTGTSPRPAKAIHELEPFFKAVHVGASKPHANWGAPRVEWVIEMSPTERLSRLHRCVMLREEFRSSIGEWQGSIADLDDAARIVRHLAETPDSYGLQVACECSKVTLKALAGHVSAHARNRDFLVEARRILDALGEPPDVGWVIAASTARTMLQFEERPGERWTFDRLAHGCVDPSPDDPDRILEQPEWRHRAVARWLQRRIDLVDLSRRVHGDPHRMVESWPKDDSEDQLGRLERRIGEPMSPGDVEQCATWLARLRAARWVIDSLMKASLNGTRSFAAVRPLPAPIDPFSYGPMKWTVENGALLISSSGEPRAFLVEPIAFSRR